MLTINIKGLKRKEWDDMNYSLVGWKPYIDNEVMLHFNMSDNTITLVLNSDDPKEKIVLNVDKSKEETELIV